MRNLLAANFFRLRKSALFWGLLAFSAGFGALIAFNYYEMSRMEPIALDGAFFVYPLTASVLTAVFVPLFFGAEYSGGAIRNKVAAGHARPAIYAANLLSGMGASLLFSGAYLVAVAVIGIPLVGPLETDAEQTALILLGSLAAMAALCAILIFVAMTCTRKSRSAMLCVLGVFLLLLAAIYIRSRLLSPEYLGGSWNAEGNYIPGRETPNPQYLRGPQRAVFEVLNILLPTCQIVQYASRQAHNPGGMLLCSLTGIALAAGIGVLLFRKKDLN